MFLNIGSAKPQIKSGNRGAWQLSGTALRRHAAERADVPAEPESLCRNSIRELVCLAAPAGLPADIAQELNAAIQAALAEPDLRDQARPSSTSIRRRARERTLKR